MAVCNAGARGAALLPFQYCFRKETRADQDLDTIARKVAGPRSGSRCNRTQSGWAGFRISIQLHDLWLGRVLDLVETARNVAWAKSGPRRNGTQSGLGEVWISIQPHDLWLGRVPDSDSTA